MLTDEQIDSITDRQWGEKAKYLHAAHRVYARVIEAAACEELDKRIAELERENARLKTVPMKYRRMAFNAKLQEKVAELERQLVESRDYIQANSFGKKSDELILKIDALMKGTP